MIFSLLLSFRSEAEEAAFAFALAESEPQVPPLRDPQRGVAPAGMTVLV